MSEERDRLAEEYEGTLSYDDQTTMPSSTNIKSFKAGYDAGVDSAQGKLNRAHMLIQRAELILRDVPGHAHLHNSLSLFLKELESK